MHPCLLLHVEEARTLSEQVHTLKIAMLGGNGQFAQQRPIRCARHTGDDGVIAPAPIGTTTALPKHTAALLDASDDAFTLCIHFNGCALSLPLPGFGHLLRNA